MAMAHTSAILAFPYSVNRTLPAAFLNASRASSQAASKYRLPRLLRRGRVPPSALSSTKSWSMASTSLKNRPCTGVWTHARPVHLPDARRELFDRSVEVQDRGNPPVPLLLGRAEIAVQHRHHSRDGRQLLMKRDPVFDGGHPLRDKEALAPGCRAFVFADGVGPAERVYRRRYLRAGVAGLGRGQGAPRRRELLRRQLPVQAPDAPLENFDFKAEIAHIARRAGGPLDLQVGKRHFISVGYGSGGATKRPSSGEEKGILPRRAYAWLNSEWLTRAGYNFRRRKDHDLFRFHPQMCALKIPLILDCCAH